MQFFRSASFFEARIARFARFLRFACLLALFAIQPNVAHAQYSTGAPVLLGGSGDSGTFATSITGTSTVTKSGVGVFTLTGTNTYTGSTVISGGTLRAGGTQAFGTGSIVNFANTDGALRGGMFARVRAVFEVREAALVVPEEALVPLGDRQLVFKVVDARTGQQDDVGRRRQHCSGIGPSRVCNHG